MSVISAPTISPAKTRDTSRVPRPSINAAPPTSSTTAVTGASTCAAGMPRPTNIAVNFPRLPSLFTAMFVGLGIPAAQVLAPVTAVVELVGGSALMLGLCTRLVSLVLAGDMVGALITDIGPNLAQKYPALWDFLSNLFYAPEWLLVGLLLWLVCVGAGKASVDALVGQRWLVPTTERRGEPD